LQQKINIASVGTKSKKALSVS